MGCTLYKIKNKCCIVMFGIVLGLIWIVMTATGTVFSAAAIAAPIVAQGICASSTDGYLGFGSKMIINSYMCTRACPCEPVAASSMNKLNNTYYNKFNRTSETGAGYDAAGYLKMYYENDASQPKFKTFNDCWTTRLVNRQNSDGTKFFNSTFTTRMNGFLKVMGAMESEFGCSGIC